MQGADFWKRDRLGGMHIALPILIRAGSACKQGLECTAEAVRSPGADENWHLGWGVRGADRDWPNAGVCPVRLYGGWPAVNIAL